MNLTKNNMESKENNIVTLSLDEYNELRDFKKSAESAINNGGFPVLTEITNTVFNVHALREIKYCTKDEVVESLVDKNKLLHKEILRLKEKDNESKKAMRRLGDEFANRSNRWVGKFFKKWLKEQLDNERV